MLGLSVQEEMQQIKAECFDEERQKKNTYLPTYFLLTYLWKWPHLLSSEEWLVTDTWHNDGVHVHLLPELLIVWEVEGRVVLFLMGEHMHINTKTRVYSYILKHKHTYWETAPRTSTSNNASKKEDSFVSYLVP